MEHDSKGNARFVQRSDSITSETDTLIAPKHRGEFTAVAPSDETVTFPYGGRNVSNLEAGSLAGMYGPTQCLKRLQEKGTDEVWLETTGFGFFHLFLYRKEPFGAHALLGQGVAVKNCAEMVMVEGILYPLT
jgi:hypothetical protein